MKLRIKHIIFSSILLVFILLTGCSTAIKDGPPPYDVDVSKIPNATPKVEALSKYGNMPVYRVNGKYYYVMNKSKNYEAEGVASWYGTKFHKHSTSSGEKYDMLAMTAAHRTLPLPTYLQVTNKENGKIVIVKVNDRGPFAENRLLDLSYAAAKKLGMLGRGTANVTIKAIDPKQFHEKDIYTDDFYIAHNTKHSVNQHLLASNTHSVNHTVLTSNTTRHSVTHTLLASNTTQHSVSHTVLVASPAQHSVNHTQSASYKTLHKNTLYLQVGAFSNKFLAEKLKKQLQPLVASSIQITQHGKPKTLYRVQIGPIQNDGITVARINKQLKSIGLKGTIMFV